uniref:Katanin p80 WD40 repeat-containing subunit B1 n=1 Tax=Eptatretus burgeri TaxID=7764 RepID=A0A8C4Q748_EPTBU
IKAAVSPQKDISAHTGEVTCLALGHNSGHVMVTGGDDQRVNLWALGKPNCIMSLTGHTSPVESVRFKDSEELVMAGSQSGSLKIWNLEAAKLVRTLTGHQVGVRGLDFHPYGEYVASGSLDKTIKVDVTPLLKVYGHADCVNCVRFSPDGRWIASAGGDGSARIWDLAAGKLLHNFTNHTDAINTVEFHPSEYLLATGSADRTVRFWDLEKFTQVSCTDGQAMPIRSVLFGVDGGCLYSGSQDLLCVLGWEPARQLDLQPVEWGRPADLATLTNQLVSPRKHVLMPFLIDKLVVDSTVLASDFKSGALKSVIHLVIVIVIIYCGIDDKEECRTSTTGEDERPEDSVAEITNEADYERIFKSRPLLNVVTRARQGHKTVCSLLISRHKKLEIIRSIWSTGDIKTWWEQFVVHAQLQLNVKFVTVHRTLWKLDICLLILPHQEKLLYSKHESYMQTGCTALKLILQNFGDIIKTNLKASPSVGVDITREERYKKCFECMGLLQRLRPLLDKQAQLAGRMGVTFRELLLLTATLD